MKPHYSELFELFAAKSIQEEGLPDKTAEAKYPFPGEGKDTGRWDSTTISDIEILYGKKTDKKHIMEEAHPETIVVAPAYDRFNGVVENEMERQNITIQQIMRNPHGAHIMERLVHAQSELSEELTRLGFLLESTGNEDLAIKADECSGELLETLNAENIFSNIRKNSELKKQAEPITIVIGIIALLGAAGLLSNNVSVSTGVIGDAGKAINQLDDLINDSDLSAHADVFLTLRKYLFTIYSAAEKTKNMNIMAIDTSKNMKDLSSEERSEKLQQAKATAADSAFEENVKFLESYKDGATFLLKRIPNYINYLNNLKNRDEDAHQSNWYDYISKGLDYVWNDGFEDVTDKLEDLMKSLGKVPGAIDQQITAMKNMKKELNTSDSDKLEKILNIDNKSSVESKKPVSDSKLPPSADDTEIKALENALGSNLPDLVKIAKIKSFPNHKAILAYLAERK